MILLNKKKIIFELFNIFREGTLKGVLIYFLFKLRFKKFKIFNRDSVNNSKTISLVGAGTYQISINLPCALKSSFIVKSVFTNGSSTSRNIANILKNVIISEKLKDIPETDAVLIGSPHKLHPSHLHYFVKKKNYIYCEKPVAIDFKGLNFLKKNVIKDKNKSNIMIGFNRRFAPLIQKLKQIDHFKNQKLEITYRINFGQYIQNNLTDEEIGGGRIIGTCCHYVDLIMYISESQIVEVSAFGIKNSDGTQNENTFSALIRLSNGSVATLIFTSLGERKYCAKETIYISGNSMIAFINDFHTLSINGKTYRNYFNNYGAMDCWKTFFDIVDKKKKSPISLSDGINATEVTLAIKKSLQNNGKLQKINSIN